MKLLFIQKDAVEHYGIMVLSALLHKEHIRTDVLIDDIEKKSEEYIKQFKPDIIAITAISSQHNWLNHIVNKIRKISNVPIVLGGPHATFYPEILKKLNIQYLIRGEGERAILQIVDTIRKGKTHTSKIENTWIKRDKTIIKNDIFPAIEDIDTLPFANRRLYDRYPFLKNNEMVTFMASRGCPYNCTFCFNQKYNELYKGKNKIFRIRSVDNVIAEITYVLNIKTPRSIVFDDDTFLLLPPKWIKEFCYKYKKITNIPFSVNARANVITKEKIKLLKYAGCNLIRMGIESFDEQLREKVMKKGITNKQIITASNIMKKHGLMIQYYFILGVPGETLETALNTYKLAKKMHPTQAWCSLLSPYPGTEIAQIAYEEGYLDKKFNNFSFENSFFTTLPLDIKNKKKIMRLQKLFQFGNHLQLPVPIIKILIVLPFDFIYNLIFQIEYGLALKRLYNFSYTYMSWIALHAVKFMKKN